MALNQAPPQQLCPAGQMVAEPSPPHGGCSLLPGCRPELFVTVLLQVEDTVAINIGSLHLPSFAWLQNGAQATVLL